MTKPQDFQLRANARLSIHLGDITTMEVDAIVNAANERMLGGGGVDGAIHRAAGPDLIAACREVPEVRHDVRCPTGEARITSGCDLPSRFVIHTVGPVYQSDAISAPVLKSAYKSSLELAQSKQLNSLAFPAISCGVFGYPIDKAAAIGLTACREHAGSIGRILFVLFSEAVFDVFAQTAGSMFAPLDEAE